MKHTDLPAFFESLLPDDFVSIGDVDYWNWLPPFENGPKPKEIGIWDTFCLQLLCPTDGQKTHCNGHYTLLYTFSGAFQMQIQGTAIRLPAGYAVFIPPEVPNSVMPCKRSDIGLLYNFRPELLEHMDELLRFPSFSVFLHGNSKVPPYQLFDTNRHPMAQWYCEEICCEHFDPDCRTYLMMRELILLMFSSLDRCTENPVSTFRRIKVDEICRYIRTNYAAATLQSTAKRFGFSPNYLSNMLKRTTGMGFQKFKQSICIAQGAQLLLNTDLSVAQISREVGIRNNTHFYHLFSKRYGVTPNQYRKAHQG